MRTPNDVNAVWAKLFVRFESKASTLRDQVHSTLVHGILAGFVPLDRPMPPSRALAEVLGVSRHTVTLAMEALVDSGFLLSKARSGLFVNPDILKSQASGTGAAPLPVPSPTLGSLNWPSRLRLHPNSQRNITKPLNWQSFPYPFIYGQFDDSLLPFADWRECEQKAVHVQAFRAWCRDHIDNDPEPLVEQIQQRLLPARGIWAARDEILVTAGAQMGVFLLSQVLLDRNSEVGVEDPGYPDARNTFELRVRRVHQLPVDEHGLVPGPALSACQYVYVTPSHQCPTTVTMPLERRKELLEHAKADDQIIFEDDHESELSFSGRPVPALKSLDTEGRVIYIGSLSKTLSHGLRIGYIVAPRELIRELRAMRRLIMRHPPANNAYAAARFVSLGYHDAFIRRLNAAYRARRKALVEAFAEFLPRFTLTPATGGSAAWIRAPRGIDSGQLARAAADAGILIEPGGVFYAQPPRACRDFRMGYSAIPETLIHEGVRRLTQIVNR